MKKPPKISIYIPTRNRSARLRQAADSVLTQSYPNIELVIVDDGSSDNTPEVIHRLQETHLNVISHRFESAQGACNARNKAISLSTGEYITGLDDDDRFLPNRVSDFMDHFDPTYSFLASSYTELDGKDQQKHFDKPDYVTAANIRKKNYIGNQIFILKTRLLDSHGFDKNLDAWQDYDLWFRLIHKYGPAKIINNGSYELNVTNDRERITTSENAHRGYRQFINKHHNALSKKELFYQELNDLYNRQVKLGFFSTLKYCKDRHSTSRILRLYLLTHFPYTIKLLLKYYLKY